MSTVTAARVGFVQAVKAQLSLLWRLHRVAFLYILLAAAAGPELISWRLNSTGWKLEPGGVFVSTLPAVIMIGLLWALVVWRDEGPSKRHYHWSLPVDVTTHDLARVVAGALWLCAGLLGNYVLGYLFTLPQGRPIQADWGWVLPAVWLVAPLTLYLLISTFAVALNRPVEWLFGGYLMMALVVALTEINRLEVVERVFVALFGPEQWGLVFVWFNGPEALSRGAPSVTTGMWLSSALLWLIVGGAVTAAAAFLRRGRA